MLAAHACGLGSCVGWIWPSENERVAKLLLGVPDPYSVRLAIALGYPRLRTRVTATHARRPTSAFVHYERFGQHVRDRA